MKLVQSNYLFYSVSYYYILICRKKLKHELNAEKKERNEKEEKLKIIEHKLEVQSSKMNQENKDIKQLEVCNHVTS